MKQNWQIKKLGEIGTFIRGGNFSKKDFVENGFPCIHYGQIHMKFGIETFKHISSVPYEMVKSDRCAKRGDLVIAITSEDDAGSCRCTVWMGDYDVYVGGHIAIYHHTMQPKFVSYYFNSPYFQKDKLEFTHGFKVVEINPSDIAKITIPVPPLEEQNRIVAVLDNKFEQIDALKQNAQINLNNAKALFQAELEKAFSNISWEIKLFSELFKLTSGEYLNSKSIIKGQYPIYGGNGIIAYHNEYNLTGDNIIIGRVGALCGNVRFLSEPIWLTDNAFKLSFLKDPFDYQFLTYLLNFKDLRKFARQAAQPVISNSSLKDIEIPIPPLEEQKRIVAHLDSLDEKVHQLEEIYTKQLAYCDELKQSLLQKAFEGDL